MKVSTALHFHLTDPVKPRVWMSANHYYTAGCIWWPSSIAKYARASSVEHVLAFQRAECLTAPELGHRCSPSELTGREGARGCWGSPDHMPGLSAALTFQHLAFVWEPTSGRRIPLSSPTPLSQRAVVLNHTHKFAGFQLKNYLGFHTYCAFWKAVWSIIPFPCQNCSVSAVQRTKTFTTQNISCTERVEL